MHQKEIWDADAARGYDTPGTGMFALEVLGPTVDRLAELAGDGPALELAIGTGRVAVPLAHACVAAPWRRQGIGTALSRVRLAAAVGQGAVQAVLFPSPDGYHLHHSLGFGLAPVHPDRWFYLR